MTHSYSPESICVIHAPGVWSCLGYDHILLGSACSVAYAVDQRAGTYTAAVAVKGFADSRRASEFRRHACSAITTAYRPAGRSRPRTGERRPLTSNPGGAGSATTTRSRHPRNKRNGALAPRERATLAAGRRLQGGGLRPWFFLTGQLGNMT